MNLSFPSIPSLPSAVPALFVAARQTCTTCATYLLDQGKVFLTSGASLAGRVSWKITLPIALLIGGIAACCFYISRKNKAADAKITELESANKRLNDELTNQLDRFSKLDGEHAKCDEDIKALKTQLEKLTAQPPAEDSEALKAEIAQLKTQIETLEKELEAYNPPAPEGSSSKSKRVVKTPAQQINEFRTQLAEARKNLQNEREACDSLRTEKFELQNELATTKKENAETFTACTLKANEYTDKIAKLEAYIQTFEGQSEGEGSAEE